MDEARTVRQAERFRRRESQTEQSLADTGVTGCFAPFLLQAASRPPMSSAHGVDLSEFWCCNGRFRVSEVAQTAGFIDLSPEPVTALDRI